MRIIHINKFFDLHGGAEIYIHQLMAAQQQRGQEVHIFSTRSEHNEPSPDRRWFVPRAVLRPGNGFEQEAREVADFFWNRQAKDALTDMLKSVKPDVIHLHNIYHHLSTSVLAPIRAFHIPCVQTLHDYKIFGCANHMMFVHGSPCERCIGGKFWNVVAHRCMLPGILPNVFGAIETGIVKTRHSYERTVDFFLCPSKFLKEKAEDWGIPSSKLRHLPNPTEIFEGLLRTPQGFLLYVGRLSPEKGLMTFVQAAATIPDLPVKIAGRGPEEERLRSYIHIHHATHIELLGFQSSQALKGLRQKAEAEVLPSEWYENAPLALLEAMAAGLPCIASRIGGIPELVEDEVSGLLSTPKDVKGWVRTLRRFQALSPERRREMGQAGRHKVEGRFLWSRHLSNLQTLYEEAIRAHQ